MFRNCSFIICIILSTSLAFAVCSISCSHDSEPIWDHIVIVIEENHNYSQVISDPNLLDFESRGASFTDFTGVTHPSQPNYIALFSGDTRGVADNLDHDLSAENISVLLKKRGLRHTSYAEGLPYAGYRGTSSEAYVRKHNPAASFTNVPDSEIQPFTSFPSDFSQLPELSCVIPDLNNDMHDGTIAAGGIWLKTNIDAYAKWAVTHNSLLIITFDEGPPSSPVEQNPLYTVFIGEHIINGKYSDSYNLYSLLAFLEDHWFLKRLGKTSAIEPVTGAWSP